MTQNRLPDYIAVIKEQVSSHEILLEYLFKVEALVEMMLTKDMSGYSKAKLHNYLWTISDLVIRAKKLSEILLNKLIRVVNES